MDGTKPEYLILDGQQRMTSLYLAMSSGKPVPTTTSKGKEIERYYYLDIVKSLDPNEDRLDAVLSVPANKLVTSDFGRKIDLDLTTQEKEFSQCYFPLKVLFDQSDYSAWRRGFQKMFRNDDVKLDLFDNFEAEVVNRFQSYRVPTIELLRDTPKEEEQDSSRLSLLLASLRKSPNALSEGMLVTQLLKTGPVS